MCVPPHIGMHNNGRLRPTAQCEVLYCICKRPNRIQVPNLLQIHLWFPFTAIAIKAAIHIINRSTYEQGVTCNVVSSVIQCLQRQSVSSIRTRHIHVPRIEYTNPPSLHPSLLLHISFGCEWYMFSQLNSSSSPPNFSYTCTLHGHV